MPLDGGRFVDMHARSTFSLRRYSAVTESRISKRDEIRSFSSCV